MKSIEQYFPVVLFIMLYKVVLPFESVDEILCFARFVTRRINFREFKKLQRRRQLKLERHKTIAFNDKNKQGSARAL